MNTNDKERKAMLTVRGKLEDKLLKMGMFESQAKEILDISIPKMNEITENYSISWHSCSSEYPEVIYNVLFMTVRTDAFQWIKKNKPQAWFRPIIQENL